MPIARICGGQLAWETRRLRQHMFGEAMQLNVQMRLIQNAHQDTQRGGLLQAREADLSDSGRYGRRFTMKKDLIRDDWSKHSILQLVSRLCV